MADGGGRGVVLVTGASSGIGEACARLLDRRGFTVLAGVRRAEDGELLRAGASSRLRPLRCDVTDPESIAACLEEVEGDGEGRLAGLVNNAGIAAWGPLEHVPLETLRAQLEVNVVGQIAVVQRCLPALRRGRGRIVNIGSISGLIAVPYLGPYCASKFALEALTDALRVELACSGIAVALVEPGAVATRIWGKFLADYPRVTQGLGAEGRARYGGDLEALRRRAERAGGLSAHAVARVVAHALTARRPRTRYLVGRDARRQAWLRWLPDRLRDRLIQRRLSG